MSKPFPLTTQLWEGAVLGGIINAVMSATSDLFGNYRQWLECNYVLDGMDGREGVVVFEHGWRTKNGYAIGLFYSPDSDIGPYQSITYNVNLFLQGMPNNQRNAANLAINNYLTMEDDHRQPIAEVTTAFWSIDGKLTANFTWEDVMLNGANLLDLEVLGFSEEALTRWKRGYGMEDEHVKLAVDLYQQRITAPFEFIHLPNHYTELFRQIIEDSRSLDVCWRLFTGLGIFLPSDLSLK